MHARPEIRQVLIAQKLKHWALVAKFPVVDKNCLPSRARRNYQKLFAKHSELAKRLGFSIASVYTP